MTPGFTDVTAVEGTDYDENTTALSFTGTKGETKTFTVDTTQDAVFEGNETFTVGLSVSNAPPGLTATDTGTGTINNDDSSTVTINDANADEGDAITFTVTLSEAVQGGLTVTPSYTNGTTASGDYTANTTAPDLHRHQGGDQDLYGFDDRGSGAGKQRDVYGGADGLGTRRRGLRLRTRALVRSTTTTVLR